MDNYRDILNHRGETPTWRRKSIIGIVLFVCFALIEFVIIVLNKLEVLQVSEGLLKTLFILIPTSWFYSIASFADPSDDETLAWVALVGSVLVGLVVWFAI